jgi:cell wall assembly regulator SMI1
MAERQDVHDTWRRLEEALSTRVAARNVALRPPASAEAVAAAEAALGTSFPPEFVASLGVHEGQSSRALEVLDGWRLYALPEIVRVWQRFCEMAADGTLRTVDDPSSVFPKGPVRPRDWDRAWIPIGADGGGEHLMLDLDPPRGGVRGQVLRHPRAGSPEVLAPGFAAWLRSVADQIESGALDESFPAPDED